MTTTTTAAEPASAPAPASAALVPFATAQHLVLDGISWAFYEEVLRELENRSGFRIAYDEGSLEIVSPLPEHELFGTWVGRLVETMSLSRDLDVVGLGSTTFRDAAAAKGLEPDECYYVQHADAAREIRSRFDPAIHAPPDLAIEVEVTRKVLPREPIYAALGVPELWLVSAKGLRCRHLDDQKRYADAAQSLAFPFLEPASLWAWADRLTRERSVSVLREFQAWVRAL